MLNYDSLRMKFMLKDAYKTLRKGEEIYFYERVIVSFNDLKEVNVKFSREHRISISNVHSYGRTVMGLQKAIQA